MHSFLIDFMLQVVTDYNDKKAEIDESTYVPTKSKIQFVGLFCIW
jgi:hypothetical protein